MDGQKKLAPVLALRRPQDDERKAAVAEMCDYLDELKEHIRTGAVTQFVAVSSGDEIEAREFAQYNQFMFGEMSRAELVGLFVMGGLLYV